MENENEKKTYYIYLDFLSGYIRYGQLEVELTDDEVKEYNSLTDSNLKKEFIEDRCDIVPTDFSIDDYSFDAPDKFKIK